MSYEEIKTIDRVEVVDLGNLQVRESTVVMRDGVEIAKTFHRWAFAPGSDISAMPDHVQAIAAAAWTPEVITAYQEQIAALEVK
jgi:hypothetical protein